MLKPKREEVLTLDDHRYMTEALTKLTSKGHAFSSWESGFICGMQRALARNQELNENQARSLETLYERHIGYEDEEDRNTDEGFSF